MSTAGERAEDGRREAIEARLRGQMRVGGVIACPACGKEEFVIAEHWPETRLDPECWTGACRRCGWEE